MWCRNRSARKACQPICALNPYNNDWTIRAKVASKTPLRRFEKNGQTNSVGTLEVVDDQVSPLRCLSAQSVSRGGIFCDPVLCQEQAIGCDIDKVMCFLPVLPYILIEPQAAAAKEVRFMQGTTIEITLWRGVADKFYDHIEEGQVRSSPHQVLLIHSGQESSILHRGVLPSLDMLL